MHEGCSEQPITAQLVMGYTAKGRAHMIDWHLELAKQDTCACSYLNLQYILENLNADVLTSLSSTI